MTTKTIKYDEVSSFIGLVVRGKTGAATSVGVAGGTSSGAPSSGTFTTGDAVIATNGVLWICTSGGSPGTWVAADGHIPYIVGATIDGGGQTLTTGAKKAYVSIPSTGTITKYRILGDQSGSIVIDVWKDTYANYPPTVADTITASAKPTVTTATKAESSTLTGWTTAVTAGDVLEFNIDSITSFTKVRIELFITPS